MTTPTVITQTAENEETQIQWTQDNLQVLTVAGISSVTTVSPLYHIARSPKYDLTNITWSINATNFNFVSLPEVISNITLTVNMNRGGRITDDTIQLCYQGQLIGENQANPAFILNANHQEVSTLTAPIATYSGDISKWAVKNLTTSMLQDPSFGVVLRYKSHPRWPHKTSPIMYSIQLQID